MHQSETLLILEGDRGLGSLMSRRLEQAGFRTIVATKSAAARRALIAEHIDLILLDQHLRDGQSGLDWYREVRGAGFNVPAVLMTASPPASMLVESMRLGVRDFLSKGGDLLDLLAPTVHRVLDLVRTERQLVESQVRAAEAESRRAELEREVTQRCKAEEKLRLADRRKDQFLAMLGHELRNPISAIDLATQLLEQAGSRGVDPAWVSGILRRQLKQVDRLLDDLLDVSRISRGKITLRRGPVDLTHILRDIEHTYRPIVEGAGHRFEVTLPTDPMPMTGDGARLTQVISNLLGNAAKYTPCGGKVLVRAERCVQEAVVIIRDDGVGIDAEEIDHIFEPFYQIERTDGELKEGLGLGLTLVDQLVRMHGGTIAARSEGRGKGSEFVIRLPLSELAEGKQMLPEVEPTGRDSLQLLVVDDQPEIAELFSRVLSTMGHQVRLARDGQKALDRVTEQTPDVVFSDVGMPGMDGHELARRIRRSPGGDRIVLVAVTGYGQDSDRDQATEAGFDHHLTKPVDLDQLSALLRGITARRTNVS